MLKNKLIDGIVKEPDGGAHVDPEKAFNAVKSEIKKTLEKLKKLDSDKLIDDRIKKYSEMGVVKER